MYVQVPLTVGHVHGTLKWKTVDMGRYVSVRIAVAPSNLQMTSSNLA